MAALAAPWSQGRTHADLWEWTPTCRRTPCCLPRGSQVAQSPHTKLNWQQPQSCSCVGPGELNPSASRGQLGPELGLGCHGDCANAQVPGCSSSQSLACLEHHSYENFTLMLQITQVRTNNPKKGRFASAVFSGEVRKFIPN